MSQKKQIPALFLIFLFSLLSVKTYSQSVTESVNFTVRTSSPGGNFSPKNIGAIWVEDSNGNFIKTLKRWADRRKQYLYTWNNASSGNVVDAITRATESSHKTHTVSWDITDVSGNTVPNGEYRLIVEMTDRHAQGPTAAFSFPVGESSNTLYPDDATFFHDIELSWVSTVTHVDGENVLNYKLSQNYPNPFNPSTVISYSLKQGEHVDLSIYNLLGEKVVTLVQREQDAGNYTVHFNASSLNAGSQDLISGVYIYRINTNNFNAAKKMIVLK